MLLNFCVFVFPRVLWECEVDPFEREVIYVSDRVPGCSEDLMSDAGNELRDRTVVTRISKVRDAQLVTRARFYANNCSSWRQRRWLRLRVWLYIYIYNIVSLDTKISRICCESSARRFQFSHRYFRIRESKKIEIVAQMTRNRYMKFSCPKRDDFVLNDVQDCLLFFFPPCTRRKRDWVIE